MLQWMFLDNIKHSINTLLNNFNDKSRSDKNLDNNGNNIRIIDNGNNRLDAMLRANLENEVL